MGDQIPDQILWNQYIEQLIRDKRNAGNSAAEAQREALQDVDRIVNGPGTGDKAVKELQDKIDDLVIKGESRERAYYHVIGQYLQELGKSQAQRVKEFLDGLRKEREKARADQSLGTAKHVATKSLWNKTGQTILKDFWNDWRFGTSENKSFWEYFCGKARLAVEETGKAASEEYFKQLNDRSFPELMAETEKALGPDCPHLTLPELFLTDSKQAIDPDVFQRFIVGRDSDRALEQLGMADLRGQKVYDAGKRQLELSADAGNKDGENWKLDWTGNPKGSVNFRLDKIAKEGLVPDTLGKLSLGGNAGLKWSSNDFTLKPEVEAEGRYDVSDMTKWRRVFDAKSLVRRGSATAKLRLGAEIRPDAILKFSFNGEIRTDVNRDGAKWSASGGINMEVELGGDEKRKERIEKVLSDDEAYEGGKDKPWDKGLTPSQEAILHDVTKDYGRTDLPPPDPKPTGPKKP